MPLKLLLVDDEEAILRVMERGLKKEYEVKTFVSAIDALKEIEGGYQPDVILSDVRMPAMDGVSFREKLRQTRPEFLTRFVYVTSSQMDPGVCEYISSNRVRVLSKPATPDDVKSVLAEHCAKR